MKITNEVSSFCTIQELSDLLREQGVATSAKRIIIAWIPDCLQTLLQKVPPSVADMSEGDAAPLQVFGEKDSFVNGREVILRGGVFMQDRVGENEMQEGNTRQAVKGRNFALWLFVRALGLHAKLGSSLLGCFANCRHQLRRKFFEGPSMRAAFYGALSMDIIRISKLGGQDFVRGSGNCAQCKDRSNPLGFLKLASRKGEDPLSDSTGVPA